jgi:hypothetical protein
MIAVVPASLVTVLVTTAGLTFVRLTLTGEIGAFLGEEVLSAENWAVPAPELPWPVWGARSGDARLLLSQAQQVRTLQTRLGL